MQDTRLERMDACRLRLRRQGAVPVNIFANEDVPIETAAVSELLQMLEIERTLDSLRRHTGAQQELDWSIDSVSVTPDFHKGAGIPIGTVLRTNGVIFPQAIGNDINCGMRLHTTNISAEDLTPHLDQWETKARRTFFEGGRQIPMTGQERRMLLTQGIPGLFSCSPWTKLGGQWEDIARYGWHLQTANIERNGTLPTAKASAYQDWVGREDTVSFDDQSGSIGGGNHFVEIQQVKQIFDRKTAYAWGLTKGTVAVMVHSGSVGIGHIAGRAIREMTKAVYPRSFPHPGNGIYPLPSDHRLAPKFWEWLHNAANFAFANRMFLAAGAIGSMEQIVGPISAPLLYDSPHNLVWQNSQHGFLHRKGATPARSPEEMAGTPFHYWGEPVLVPGSMGASSFVLAGRGNPAALSSASHGAGRSLSRGKASRSHYPEFEEFLKNFRVVTPLDLRKPEVRSRADILSRKLDELRSEGPHAYKSIDAVIKTLEAANMAQPVAELAPIATIKG